MRKATGTALAIALLALPAAAAGDAQRAARGGDNFEIRFAIKHDENRDPTFVKRFRMRGLTASCGGGATAEIGVKIRSIPVNDRRVFRATVRRNGKLVRVRGRISRDLDTVRGKVRGRLPSQGCDSGVVRWRSTSP